MMIDFVKMQGTGNDFILIDRTDSNSDVIKWKKLVIGMCERKIGIGADGVLVIERSKNNDFLMRIFNPDGSEVDMCGNGARCAAYYHFIKDKTEQTVFETLAGVMKAELSGKDNVRLILPDPEDTRLDILIRIETGELSVSYINTGVPHVIVETDKLDDMDVNNIGRAVRFNDEFAPDGTNVNFVKVTGESSLEVRTYERGVEEETLACGTGVIAAAVIEALRGKVTAPVSVQTNGGDILKVHFNISDGEELSSRIYNVKLEGSAEVVYKGRVELPV